MGIRIMRYRARVIGTTLDLKSQPNQGTQIIVHFNQPSADAERRAA
jgi:nitrate/nitrite-specific signal transduction histidine kinase